MGFNENCWIAKKIFLNDQIWTFNMWTLVLNLKPNLETELLYNSGVYNHYRALSAILIQVKATIQNN